MIVASEFPGDDDTTLMHIQHDSYCPHVSELFRAARLRYLAAAGLLEVEDELTQLIRFTLTFDHRTLQYAHDLLAARFRYQSKDSTQIRLGEDPDAHQQRLAAQWDAWFTREVNERLEDPLFTRAILTAAAWANQDRGVQAESTLARLLALPAHLNGASMNDIELAASTGCALPLRVEMIHDDPARFQSRGEWPHPDPVGDLSDVNLFDPDLAGLLMVWFDPSESLVYVVDGHKRLDLARRRRTRVVDARLIRAESDADAFARGVAMNVFKYVRDPAAMADAAGRRKTAVIHALAAGWLDPHGPSARTLYEIYPDLTPTR
jgi:hypothetical protein